MVKLTGPLQSAAASGSFGPSTVFSSWKGRSYAKTKSIPSNPRSPMQVSTRAMMAFLSSAWASLTTPQQATWASLAGQSQIPPYNQFISSGLGRWSEFHAPAKVDPATETGTQPDLDSFYATGGAAHADISADWYALQDAWGLMIFRSLASGFTPSLSNCIAIIPLTKLTGLIYTDAGLPPARYYYNFQSFTAQGKKSASLGQVTALVT